MAGVDDLLPDRRQRFVDWHYRKDPTHVVFYRAETMQFIAAMRGWTCEIPVKDVALFRTGP